MTRHRGVCYDVRNVRYFVSWLCKEALLKAEGGQDGVYTSNLEYVDSEVKAPITFDDWKKRFNR